LPPNLRDKAAKKGAFQAAVRAEELRGTICGFYRDTGPTGQQQAFFLNIEGIGR
jgi:hypothetical protein